MDRQRLTTQQHIHTYSRTLLFLLKSHNLSYFIQRLKQLLSFFLEAACIISSILLDLDSSRQSQGTHSCRGGEGSATERVAGPVRHAWTPLLPSPLCLLSPAVFQSGFTLSLHTASLQPSSSTNSSTDDHTNSGNFFSSACCFPDPGARNRLAIRTSESPLSNSEETSQAKTHSGLSQAPPRWLPPVHVNQAPPPGDHQEAHTGPSKPRCTDAPTNPLVNYREWVYQLEN